MRRAEGKRIRSSLYNVRLLRVVHRYRFFGRDGKVERICSEHDELPVPQNAADESIATGTLSRRQKGLLLAPVRILGFLLSQLSCIPSADDRCTGEIQALSGVLCGIIDRFGVRSEMAAIQRPPAAASGGRPICHERTRKEGRECEFLRSCSVFYPDNERRHAFILRGSPLRNNARTPAGNRSSKDENVAVCSGVAAVSG